MYIYIYIYEYEQAHGQTRKRRSLCGRSGAAKASGRGRASLLARIGQGRKKCGSAGDLNCIMPCLRRMAGMSSCKGIRSEEMKGALVFVCGHVDI